MSSRLRSSSSCSVSSLVVELVGVGLVDVVGAASSVCDSSSSVAWSGLHRASASRSRGGGVASSRDRGRRTAREVSIDQVLKRLVRPAIYGDRVPLSDIRASMCTASRSAWRTRAPAHYEPFEVGRVVGRRMGHHVVPDARRRSRPMWRGSEVVALIDLGGAGHGRVHRRRAWCGTAISPARACTSSTGSTSSRNPRRAAMPSIC